MFQVLDRDFEAEGFRLAGHGGTADDVDLHVQQMRDEAASALDAVADEARQQMAMIDRELIRQAHGKPTAIAGDVQVSGFCEHAPSCLELTGR